MSSGKQEEKETVKNNESEDFCDPETCYERTFPVVKKPNVKCEICKEIISWKHSICGECSKKYNKCIYCSKIKRNQKEDSE